MMIPQGISKSSRSNKSYKTDRKL